MPARRKKEEVAGQFFRWLVWRRNGVYYADGRSGNRVNAGRHSLGTDDRTTALEALKQVDLVQAVAHGLADRSALEEHDRPLALADGRELYERHVGRARVLGGVKPASMKRYRAVVDKFIPFALLKGARTWNQVNARLLGLYANHLEAEGYAYATQYLELTSLKQMANWLTDAGHLVGAKPIVLPMKKPAGTTTYCWRPEEVRAMVEHCRQQPDLAWLEGVLVALACTGLRISELASLRWSDVDPGFETIHLTDESRMSRRRGKGGRETKSGRDRSLPVYSDLVAVLKGLSKLPDGHIFHGPLGGRLKPDMVRTALIRDVLEPLKGRFPENARAGGFADGRLHSFRHYFCSTCASSGVPEQVVMSWLGHSDSKMVKHYFHLHDEEARRQMKRLDFLGGQPGGVAGRGVGSDG